MNKDPSSSEDGLDSDADIGSDNTEDLNDGFDADSRAADESSHVLDEDPVMEDEGSVEANIPYRSDVK